MTPAAPEGGKAIVNCRKLGKTGIPVSEVGLGTWELSGDVWGAKDDHVSKCAILAGIERGASFLDTAADYGDGHVEELIGQLISCRMAIRHSLVIGTKVKPENNWFTPPPEVPIEDAYRPGWIREQLERSLSRLRTDYVDILFMHTWSPAWSDSDDWYLCLRALRDEGKVRAFGISVPDEMPTAANAHVEAGRVDVIQVVYNAFQQAPEHTLFPLARQRGVGIIARSPFSSGVLVEGWTRDMSFAEGDWRGRWPLHVKPGWLEEQVCMAHLVAPILDSTRLPRPVAALRFILDNPDVTSVIPGSANPEHVRTNVTAGSGYRLDAFAQRQLRDLWLRGRVHGTYNGSV